MSHPTFEDAGASPGMLIWTIEKFEPVPIDTNIYGKFYNGDSYIVLKTTGDETEALRHDAHFWLGSKTTQDKMGSAAIWTVTLDDMLGGRAVHHREVQGHESSLFLGYFKPAIRYMEGGNESGFNEVQTNAGAEKRLLKLSGCDNMRIEEVEADASSLTRDHCFILEVEHDIFVLMPEGARATQRRKIILVANSLRDDYHNGRATIEIIDEFSSDDDVALFFEALGSGCKEDLQNDDTTNLFNTAVERWLQFLSPLRTNYGNDLFVNCSGLGVTGIHIPCIVPIVQALVSLEAIQESYTRDDISAVYLYRVLVGDELELISLSKPYKQSQLSSEEIYILDTPCSGVYIWIGSGVDPDVKKTYNEMVDKYFDVKGYPAWVNVTRVTEGSESSTFKQYFHDWTSIVAYSKALVSESDAGYFSEDTELAAVTAKLIGKSAAARGYMPDQGDGSLTVIRVSQDQEDVTEKFSSGLSVFYQGDVYVVKYQLAGSEGQDTYVVYCWIGADADPADKASGLELANQIENEIESPVTVVKVPQSKEPKHFLSIFKGNLAIIFGKQENGYTPENSRGSYGDDGVRLFRVEGTELGVDMRAIQLPEIADNLEDDDVYVLETKDLVYVWNGKESNSTEQEAAAKFVAMVLGDEKETTVLEQGDEPEEFWEALGGAVEEKADPSGWRLAVNRRVTSPRTLTGVTVSVTGKIKFEELDTEYTQQDLSDDGVYILDTGEELYLWQGKNVAERVKQARADIIKEYIEDDGLERTVDSAIVVVVKQGAEPSIFKKLFQEWDDDMWDNLSSYEDIKNETIAANSK